MNLKKLMRKFKIANNLSFLQRNMQILFLPATVQASKTPIRTYMSMFNAGLLLILHIQPLIKRLSSISVYIIIYQYI